MVILLYNVLNPKNFLGTPPSFRSGETGGAGNFSYINMKNGKNPLWSSLSLAWELGYTIAIPIVILGLAGRLLDRKFDTSPWLLLTGIFLSIFLSTLGIYYKTTRILAELDKKYPPKDKSRRPPQGESGSRPQASGDKKEENKDNSKQ